MKSAFLSKPSFWRTLIFVVLSIMLYICCNFVVCALDAIACKIYVYIHAFHLEWLWWTFCLLSFAVISQILCYVIVPKPDLLEASGEGYLLSGHDNLTS